MPFIFPHAHTYMFYYTSDCEPRLIKTCYLKFDLVDSDSSNNGWEAFFQLAELKVI